jgi:hypothetical protein
MKGCAEREKVRVSFFPLREREREREDNKIWESGKR